MKYDPAIHHRRSIRLPGFDYSKPGQYFVTICTQHRLCLFGTIENGKMSLNEYGEIVQAAWDDLPCHYQNINLHEFVIMPNHVHGIVGIINPVEPIDPTSTKRHGLPEIIRAFKTFSAKRINEKRETPGTSVWQRNYYERIIRDETAYLTITNYIRTNPQRWIDDSNHI
jgi:putative transposase